MGHLHTPSISTNNGQYTRDLCHRTHSTRNRRKHIHNHIHSQKTKTISTICTRRRPSTRKMVPPTPTHTSTRAGMRTCRHNTNNRHKHKHKHKHITRQRRPSRFRPRLLSRFHQPSPAFPRRPRAITARRHCPQVSTSTYRQLVGSLARARPHIPTMCPRKNPHPVRPRVHGKRWRKLRKSLVNNGLRQSFVLRLTVWIPTGPGGSLRASFPRRWSTSTTLGSSTQPCGL